MLANGARVENVDEFPFVLSLPVLSGAEGPVLSETEGSKHEGAVLRAGGFMSLFGDPRFLDMTRDGVDDLFRVRLQLHW